MGRYGSKITSGSAVAKASANDARCKYCILTCSGTCSTLCTGKATNRPGIGQSVGSNKS